MQKYNWWVLFVFLMVMNTCKIYISWFFNCFDDRFATNFFNIIGTWFQKLFRHGLKKEGRMFCQKCHQIIKHGFVQTYLYFSTILIYRTTTANINSSEYIMPEKNYPLLWHSSYNAKLIQLKFYTLTILSII